MFLWCILLQSERAAQQWAAWEKQQKEIEKNEDIIKRLSGGAQSGRASQVRLHTRSTVWADSVGRGGAGEGLHAHMHACMRRCIQPSAANARH